MSDYFFGCTMNVGSCGVCIHARPNHIPMKDSLVTLMLAPGVKSRFSKTDIPLEI